MVPCGTIISGTFQWYFLSGTRDLSGTLVVLFYNVPHNKWYLFGWYILSGGTILWYFLSGTWDLSGTSVVLFFRTKLELN